MAGAAGAGFAWLTAFTLRDFLAGAGAWSLSWGSSEAAGEVSKGPPAGAAISAGGAGLFTCGAVTFAIGALCAIGWKRCQPVTIPIASSEPAIPTTRTSGKGRLGGAGDAASPPTGARSGIDTIGAIPGGGPGFSRNAAFWRISAATVFPNSSTIMGGGTAARAVGANAWAEVAWAGVGGDAGMAVGGLPAFPSRDPCGSAHAGGGIFVGGVLDAFAAGRGGVYGKGARDSVAGDEVTFAAGGPGRLAGEGAARGKGFAGWTGDTSSRRAGTLTGAGTPGMVPGDGPVA